MTFDDAFEKLLGHEGGYSNNPADPGGETRYGITRITARKNGYLGEMRDLPKATAKEIAKRQYWDAVSADAMPDAVRFDLFDGAYNSGPAQAIRWLQRAVFVDADGVVGPRTLMAASTYSPQSICARYNGHRLAMMTDLPTWSTFGRGWSKRIAANLQAAMG